MSDSTHPLQVAPAASRGPNALVVALLSVIVTVLVMDRVRPDAHPLTPIVPAPIPSPPGPSVRPLGDGFSAIGVARGTPSSALADPDIGARIGGLGGDWFVVDAERVGIPSPRWLAFARSRGLPALVLLRRDGSVYHLGALPSSAVGVIAAVEAARDGRPAPAVAVDSHFLSLGKAYLPQLGATYAAAWEGGAKLLDAGQPLSTALAAVGDAWKDVRTKLFDRVATPEFNRIFPESSKDQDMTPAQRAAMAAAWRGFARGLSGGKGPALFVPLPPPSATRPSFVGRPRIVADLLASPQDAPGDAAPRHAGGTP